MNSYKPNTMKKCKNCDGRGWTTYTLKGDGITETRSKTCPVCDGAGVEPNTLSK